MKAWEDVFAKKKGKLVLFFILERRVFHHKSTKILR
jgi:hypothetical protein